MLLDEAKEQGIITDYELSHNKLPKTLFEYGEGDGTNCDRVEQFIFQFKILLMTTMHWIDILRCCWGNQISDGLQRPRVLCQRETSPTLRP